MSYVNSLPYIEIPDTVDNELSDTMGIWCLLFSAFHMFTGCSDEHHACETSNLYASNLCGCFVHNSFATKSPTMDAWYSLLAELPAVECRFNALAEWINYSNIVPSYLRRGLVPVTSLYL